MRRVRITALVVGALLLPAACSSSDDRGAAPPVAQLGGPGETNRVLTDEEVAALEVPGHSATDVPSYRG